MNAYRLARLAVASFLVLAAFVALPTDRSRSAPADDRADVPRPHVERERVRAHLLGAELALRTADVSHLSEAQRERRARAVTLLREYRRAGVFPHNHDFPDQRRPYFVDRHGTLCAMAYLIARTGGEELVARVARTANNAYVADLAGDTEFRAWLDQHGMTVPEAARVQPAYDCCWPEPTDRPDVTYATLSAGHAALSGAAIALQLADDGAPDDWRSIVGFATGGAGILLGAAGLDGSDGNAQLAALNFGMGASALGLAVWRLTRGGGEPDPVVGDAAGPGLSWSAAPALSRDGAAGVTLALRF